MIVEALRAPLEPLSSKRETKGFALDARSLERGAWSTANEAAWSTPPHLDVSVARGRWAAGIALGVPFGSGVAWPSDWVGRHEAVRSQLQVFRAAPFFAWRAGRVRVSGGVHLDAGSLEVERRLDFIDTEGDVHIAVGSPVVRMTSVIVFHGPCVTGLYVTGASGARPVFGL